MLRYAILLFVPIIVLLTAWILSRRIESGPPLQLGIPEFLFMPLAFWPCCYVIAHPDRVNIYWMAVHQIVGAQAGWFVFKAIDSRRRWSAPLSMSIGAWLGPVLGLYVIVMAKVFGYDVL